MTVSHVRRFVLCFCALGLLAAAASAAEWRRGIITDMDGGRVMVTNQSESTMVGVSSSTLVTLNGRPAKLRDLSVGDVALVMYIIQGGNRPTAQRVDAFR